MKPINLKIILRNILYYWFPTVLWASVIFYFSALSVIKTSEFYWQDFLLKKSAHFIEYAILSTLIFRSLLNSKVSKKNAIVASIFISIIYAISDEIHQSFTPGREPRLRDIIIDGIGSIGSMIVITYIGIKNNKKLNLYLKKVGLHK